jgi:hypothetical protein
MKKLIAGIALLISISIQAQNWPIDKETNKILFTDVIKVDSVSQDELFLRAHEWCAKSYNDSKEVIQLNDKNAGKIVGKGAFRVTVKAIGMVYAGGYVKYTFSIAVKEGRFKYEISDFYHTKEGSDMAADGGSLENEKPVCGTFMITKSYWSQIKSQAYDNTIALIESLNTFMTAKSDTKNDNW